MRLRRCMALQVTLDDEARFDVASLLAGGDGLDRAPRWLASAPHRAEPAEVTLAQLAVLATLPADAIAPRDALVGAHGAAVVDALVAAGWLLDADDSAQADADARDVPWWPPALHAQAAGTWRGIDIAERQDLGLMPDAASLVEANGPPPTHAHRRAPAAAARPLQLPAARPFDALLAARRTCRNFDPVAVLDAASLATMLHRVWGAVGTRELAPGAVAVKKTSPAGGGLHAVEAYLLVQRVEGLVPGLYHYLPLEHAVELLRPLDADAARAAAHRVLAGQHWFVDAPVFVIMTARFDRLFWKYRRHAKAWRVVHLDAGHLSQTMYLSAADLGLGAFVTAAINDGDIAAMLDLAPLREAAIAVVGFGARSATPKNIELDGLTAAPGAQRRDG